MIYHKNMEHLSAWALLSLAGRSAPGSPTKHSWSNYTYEHSERAIAKLRTREFEYMIRQKRITIGRSSQRLRPDVSMGHSKFISRLHLEIYYEAPNFYMICNSRNGVFVDGIFRRKNSPLQLPKHCLFRFPSTNIRLVFQSLIDDECLPDDPMITKTEADPKTMSESDKQIGLQPVELLKAAAAEAERIDPITPQPKAESAIHKHTDKSNPPSMASDIVDRPRDESLDTPHVKSSFAEASEAHASWTSRLAATFDTPVLSPAGTISATNSCPTSPRPFSMVYANSVNSNLMNNVEQNFVDSANEIVIDTDGNTTTMHSMDAINLALTCPYLDSGVEQLRPEQKSTSNGKSSNSAVNSSTRHSEDGKPPYSYAQLIVQAISAAHDKQSTLNGIYSYITKNYPYYRTADKGWQNSIRHNLSLNRYFVKVPRSQEEPGKGSFWRIEAMSEPKLLDQAFRRRRQRPAVSSSRGKLSSSKSAPVSPTGAHHLHNVDEGVEASDDLEHNNDKSLGEDNLQLESASCSGVDDVGSTHHGDDREVQAGHITPDSISSSP